MYGDTAALRRRAAQLREQGGDIRALADQLLSRSEGVAWTGRAASMMRERMRDRAAQLRETAHAHEEAADSLALHLGEIDRLTEAIAGIERRAAALLGDAGRAPAGFEPPPPGHRDWLDVTLPGL